MKEWLRRALRIKVKSTLEEVSSKPNSRDIRKIQERIKELQPENCDHSRGYEVAYTNYICAKCGALMNNTPLGREIVDKDARQRWGSGYDVERWKLQEALKMMGLEEEDVLK